VVGENEMGGGWQDGEGAGQGSGRAIRASAADLVHGSHACFRSVYACAKMHKLFIRNTVMPRCCFRAHESVS
jgi:hypothetical protein